MVVRELLVELGFKADASGAQKFNKALGTTVKIMGAVTAVASAVGGAALKSAGEFEQAQIAFETMTGSAQVAGDLLKDITQFAAKTPFKMTGLIESSKNLIAFGFEADEIVDKMEYLGNIAAGVGKDKLPTLIAAFGKIRTKGKASMEELNMMLEAGVPILDELAKQYGVTTQELFKMISKGEVGFENVDRALQGLGLGSGRFGGLMERQSRSFLGIISNIGDFIDRLRIAIGQELLADASRLAREFLNFAEANQEVIKAGIVKFLKMVALGVAFLFVLLKRMLPVLLRLAKTFASRLQPILKWFFSAIKIIVPILWKYREVLISVGIAIGLIVAAMKGLNAIMAIVNAVSMMNPWVLLLVAVIVLVVLLVRNWDKVKEAIGRAWEAMKNFAEKAKEKFKEIGLAILGFFDPVFQLFNKIFEAIASVVNKFTELTNTFGGKVVDFLVNTFDGGAQPSVPAAVAGGRSRGMMQTNNTNVEVNLPPGTDPADADAVGQAVSAAIDERMNRYMREGITNTPSAERGRRR